LSLKPDESDSRKGALKSYFHVGDELARVIKQDAKAQIGVMTFLTRANGVSFPALPGTEKSTRTTTDGRAELLK
jgi:hypothetical protein